MQLRDYYYELINYSKKQRPQSAGGRGQGHAPDQSVHGRRHDRSHPGREHRRQQRGERPHRGLDPAAPCWSATAPLELTEADEEEDECRVGDEHERDGAGVAPGLVDDERRVARQDTEAYLGEPRIAPVQVHAMLSCSLGQGETGTGCLIVIVVETRKFFFSLGGNAAFELTWLATRRPSIRAFVL